MLKLFLICWLLAGVSYTIHFGILRYMIEKFAWNRNGAMGNQYVFLSLLLYIVYFIPLLIFPVGAYYCRHSLYGPTSITGIRLGVFLLFTSCSVAFYWLFQAGFSVIRTLPKARNAHFTELVREAKSAPIEAEILQAHLLEDNNEGGVLELTVQISNVPLSLPLYSFTISQTDHAFTFSTINGKTYPSARPSSTFTFYAINENGTWSFHRWVSRYKDKKWLQKQESHVPANSMTFVIEFKRNNRLQTERYPGSIVLRLTMPAYDYKVFQQDEIFFEHTMPVSYREHVQ